MLELIVNILETIGIESVTTAENGVQAWQQFEEGQQFDLVICDWIMPEMDGLEVLKNIRAGRSAIPFILVTVRDSEEAIKRAVNCGITAFIAKPIAAEEFISVVLRVLPDGTSSGNEADAWEF
ncbi:MAG: response regulator [Alphaproteobacteria bacterium]|nr:response regulator [Alphaproteobacteria bacterium]